MLNDMLQLLRGDPGLMGLLGQYKSRPSIDIVERPRKASLPAITISQISTTPKYHQYGISNLKETRVQVDSWGRTYGDAHKLEARCSAFLETVERKKQGQTEFIRIYLDSARDRPVTDIPGENKVFHRTADYIVWHR